MLSSWKVMRVVHSVPEQSWGLAEFNGETIFFRSARGMELRLKGVTLTPAFVSSVTIPNRSSEILVNDIVSAERGGTYRQAGGWMPKAYAEKMQAARAKAANTLAELAAKAEEENRTRQAWLQEVASRHLGSGQKSQKGNKEKGGRKVRQSA